MFQLLIQFEHINCFDIERKKEREEGEREKSGVEEEMHRIELINSKPLPIHSQKNEVEVVFF